MVLVFENTLSMATAALPTVQASGKGQESIFFDREFEERVTHDTEDLLGHDVPYDASVESSASPTGVVRVYLAAVKDRII